MTTLTIVQNACTRLSLPKPNAVTTSTVNLNVQMLALLNEEVDSLARRATWQALTTETSFTTVAAETQGAISTIAPGLRFIINDTIQNRSLRRPVFGPLTAQRWQQYKSLSINGPWNQFRIRGGNLIFIPTPTAGQSCYFEYVTNYAVLDGDTSAAKASYTKDSDTSLLDESLLTLGLIWRFKQSKGFDFETDLQKYENNVRDAIGRDGSKDWLNMSDTRYDIAPGILVPSGSWNV